MKGNKYWLEKSSTGSFYKFYRYFRLYPKINIDGVCISCTAIVEWIVNLIGKHLSSNPNGKNDSFYSPKMPKTVRRGMRTPSIKKVVTSLKSVVLSCMSVSMSSPPGWLSSPPSSCSVGSITRIEQYSFFLKGDISGHISYFGHDRHIQWCHIGKFVIDGPKNESNNNTDQAVEKIAKELWIEYCDYWVKSFPDQN